MRWEFGGGAVCLENINIVLLRGVSASLGGNCEVFEADFIHDFPDGFDDSFVSVKEGGAHGGRECLDGGVESDQAGIHVLGGARGGRL